MEVSFTEEDLKSSQQLLKLVSDRPTPSDQIQDFVKSHRPQAWLQESHTGWTALHYAALRNDLKLVDVLFKRANAKWELVDNTGCTAMDVAYSCNYTELYTALINEGIRAQMLRTLLEQQEMEEDEEDEDDEQAPGDEEMKDGTEEQQQQPQSSAAHLQTYLQSKLIFAGEGDREVCLDAEGNGVMMGWETGIMNKTATLLCEDHPNAAHLRVLNVGHGLGIVDELLQQHGQQPAKHVIVEAHPDVLKHMREKGWYDRPGVEIFEGQWQDWLKTNQETFDVVYWDTFSEHYRDLYAFFDKLPDILDSDGRFSFFHGLGATNRSFYDIYTSVSEMHLKDMGLQTQWYNVDVPDGGEVRWEGVVRRYWDLPTYRLPICTFDM